MRSWKITIRKPDPDKVRYNFWVRHREFAPAKFSWEKGEAHYEFTHGFHPHKPGPRVMTTLEKVWGKEREVRPGKPTDYLAYMMNKMPSNIYDLCSSCMTNLTQCEDVVGDCTLENIVITTDRVVIIDPGYTRGLVCIENDLAKLMQSGRGWEKAKQGEVPITPCDLGDNLAVVAIYITHLYRLLRHKHSEWCLRWAQMEVDNAVSYLLNRC
jgi:hypothetical protein